MKPELETLYNHESQQFPPKFPPIIGYASTHQDLPTQLFQMYSWDRIERTTHKGYHLPWHKDHHFIRKFKNGYRFIPYDKQPKIEYTLLWYPYVDCKGASIEFYPNTQITPTTNMFILFDSSHIHRVLPQHNGSRHLIIYKFYASKNQLNSHLCSS